MTLGRHIRKTVMVEQPITPAEALRIVQETMNTLVKECHLLKIENKRFRETIADLAYDKFQEHNSAARDQPERWIPRSHREQLNTQAAADKAAADKVSHNAVVTILRRQRTELEVALEQQATDNIRLHRLLDAACQSITTLEAERTTLETERDEWKDKYQVAMAKGTEPLQTPSRAPLDFSQRPMMVPHIPGQTQ